MLLVIFLVLTGNGYAQRVRYELKYDTVVVKKTRIIKIVTLRTVPRFILQVSGSYNSGALELTGHNGGFSLIEFLRGENYGARNGIGGSITAKIPLHKKGNFWLDISGGYRRFQSDLIAKNTEEGKVAYNLVSGLIGADYYFNPADRVKYFIGGGVQGNMIWGNATLNFPGSTPGSVAYRKDVKIKSSFRLGYSVYVGLDYAFEKNVGLNLGFSFTHANLLLKKTTSQADTSSTDLNDDKVETNIPYAGWKQFAYSTVYAGISFYFGVKERRYKLP